MRRSMLSCAALAATLLMPPVAAQTAAAAPAISSEPYPGTIALHVDATDVEHRVMRVRQSLPVRAGPLTLYHPRWIPGHHAPSGDVNLLAGLTITARGQPLAWARDPLDTHAFKLDVPAGVSALELEFQHLSPVAEASGRIAMTREMMNVQWQSLLLYPAGHSARAIGVQPRLTLPAGWQWAGALRAEQSNADAVRFAPVSLETLVDSPLFAGAHVKRFELDAPGHPRPVALHVFADSDEALKADDKQIDAHRQLVQQADKLFGSRHFAHYDFMLALSDKLGHIGLEHHQSSENAVKPNYFKDWDKAARSRDLLPHEYVHSWNGKFRRPQDLDTLHFNAPASNSLLWLYEGQTEYWGRVLAVRAGLVSTELARERLAAVAAAADQRSGRRWRNLQDTTNDPITARRAHKDWRSWQRATDYYNEAVLIWLDADTLIREKTNGARSLDDFARAFFGQRDGELGPLPYTFDDIVAALDAVMAHDWARFLRQRLDSHAAEAPKDGLQRGGWKLAYADTPGDDLEASEADWKTTDFHHSLGVDLNNEGKLGSVQWDGPAFQAGLAPGMSVVAVNMRAYKADGLKAAIVANKDGKAPIDLLVRDGDRFVATRIDWRGGLRFPKLERVDGTQDHLGAVLKAR